MLGLSKRPLVRELVFFFPSLLNKQIQSGPPEELKRKAVTFGVWGGFLFFVFLCCLCFVFFFFV